MKIAAKRYLGIAIATLSSIALINLPPVSTLAQTQQIEEDSTNEQNSYSIFMLVKTTNSWLSLSPDQRFAFLGTDIEPILQAHPQVKMQFFDTEGFNSRVSDVIIWSTKDLQQYQSLVEQLRESKFWGTYFEIVEILPGIENGYAQSYDVEPYGQ